MTRADPQSAQHARRVHTVALDAVRGCAALVVFVSHTIQIIWLPATGLGSLVHAANSFASETAVIVFFVLSGYLISLSICGNIRRNGEFAAWDYLRSRALRIYPPFLGAVAVSVAVFLVLQQLGLPGIRTPLRGLSDLYAARESISIDLPEIIQALALRNGLLEINGPLWSLYIEVRLYVAAGVAAVAFQYAPYAWLRIPAAVAGALLTSLLIGKSQPGYLLYSAWWLLGTSFFVWRYFGQATLAALVALLLAVIILARSTSPISVELCRLAFVVALSLLMFGRWRSAPKVAVGLGAFSYSLYLLHFPLLVAGYSLLLAAWSGESPSMTARAALSIGSSALILILSAAIGSVLENPARLRGLFSTPAPRTSA
ncbi:acyltransferase family protein [Bradyrhizobium symbiodeficiens]|uniref:acyltransferase family protein n=1 Tax=Bradyrhizobium symbiodeficiens TaxID=1404367 RepID=UPI00140FAD32|nr:acyltransferase [Bradyrhizobium symbiodeficiens]QIP01744.1 acyltransferase [Bradyrhizobium symbiodeficiens]